MNRTKAAAIHLGLSILIGAIVFLWLHRVWYPSGLFTLTGGISLLKILLSVDIVLGPLITLIIFNTQKKSLRFDLSCIAILQMAALAYGVYTMWLARPVWIAYVNEHFEVVSVPKIIGNIKGSAMHQKLPIWGPKLIGVIPEKKLRGQFDVEVGLGAGALLSSFTQGWQPYEKVKNEVMQKGQSLKELSKKQASLSQKLQQRYGGNASTLRVFPLLGGLNDALILIDSTSGEWVEIINL
ncbi:MAG: hypothetical protein V4525_10185 [Pseudomonadota bacterium]